MPSKFVEILKKDTNKDLVNDFARYCKLSPTQKENDAGTSIKKKIMRKNINYSIIDIVSEMDTMVKNDPNCVSDVKCSTKMLRSIGLDILADLNCSFVDVHSILKKIDNETNKDVKGSCSQDTC